VAGCPFIGGAIPIARSLSDPGVDVDDRRRDHDPAQWGGDSARGRISATATATTIEIERSYTESPPIDPRSLVSEAESPAVCVHA